MSSRCRASFAFIAVAALVAGACNREERHSRAKPIGETVPAGESPDTIWPGGTVPQTLDPRAKLYDNNAPAISQGQQLFTQMNCVGCHSHGGGGMGPALMDDRWIYGSDDASVFETIARGRPNGMPAFGSRITESQIWMLAAYVESMSGRLPMDVLPSRADHMRYSTPENSRRARPPQGAPKGADE